MDGFRDEVWWAFWVWGFGGGKGDGGLVSLGGTCDGWMERTGDIRGLERQATHKEKWTLLWS
jgi:hypothetical protein